MLSIKLLIEIGLDKVSSFLNCYLLVKVCKNFAARYKYPLRTATIFSMLDVITKKRVQIELALIYSYS